MNIKYLLLFTVLGFQVSILSGQSKIKGTVFDSATRESLVGAVVSADSSINTITTVDGSFQLKLSKGTHRITFTFYSYYDKTLLLDIDKDSLNLNILLQSKEQTINPVVVSASLYGKDLTRENVSMEVIPAKNIENIGAVTVDEALKNLPGVDVTYDGQANIRGGNGWAYGAGSRVLMLVDGLPELTSDAADVIWDFLPIEQVQQIEVLKGASSVLYGSSALDGVINLRTVKPTTTPQTDINVFEGLYGNVNMEGVDWWNEGQAPGFQGFTFMHSQKFGRLDLVTSGDVYNETSYLLGQYHQRIRGSINASYRFKKIDGLVIGLRVNEMWHNEGSYLAWQNDSTGLLKPFGGLGSSSSTIIPGKFLRESIDPYITYFTPDGGKITLQGRYFVSDNIDYGLSDGSRSQLRYSELIYQKSLPFRINFTGGLVADGNEIASQLYGQHTGSNLAAYSQIEKTLGKLILTAGVRYEKYEVDTIKGSSPVVFRAGVNYQLFKATTFRASYGEGYRFPSVAEQFIKTNIGGVLSIFPNPDIKPEHAYSSELGINQGVKIGKWLGDFDVAAFQTVYSNMINFTFGFYPPPGTPVSQQHTLQYFGASSVNVVDALIQGLEFTFNSEGKIVGLPVTIYAGFTALNPINVATRNYVDSLEKAEPSLTTSQKDSLKNTEILNYRTLYSGKAGFELTIHKFMFGGDFRYNSFQVNVDPIFAGTQKIGPLPLGDIFDTEGWRKKHNTGDYIIDVHISYQASKVVKFTFFVKNLLNRLYTDRPGMIDPPRTFMVQSTIKF